MGYEKTCFWIDPSELEVIENRSRDRGLQTTHERHLPCRVLRESAKVGCIHPEAWEAMCKRKTSWYFESPRKGKVLIVRDAAIDLRGLDDVSFIACSPFEPPFLPSYDQILTLAQSLEYLREKPSDWDRVEPQERTIHERWLRRFGVDASFDDVLLYHSANHANFCEPRFFVCEEGVTVPYSIAGSTHVCSSCLEFFGILGERWPIKYVVPCLGAVQFGRLTRDRYFRVETQKRG